jgi:hypothetical protein
MVVKLSDFLNTTFSTLSANDTNNTGVTYPGTVVHSTTLTPGVGIGAGLEYQVETSNNNNETGMLLETVTTDVTPGSEDFDFVVKLMQNGAAASEKFRVTSPGNVNIPSGNLAVGRTGATYRVDVVGGVNAAAFFVNGSPTSIQGVQGATGTGVQGATGTGSQGIQGIQGITGTGTQGATGTGTQGATGTGVQGITGDTGNKGGVRYNFSTTTSDSDPGQGILRYNNSTIGSVTQLIIDNTNIDGISMTAWYDTWDDSTTTSSRGYVYIVGNEASSTVTNIFQVTGSVSAQSGYYRIPVSFVSGSLPSNSTPLTLHFARTGNIGTQGATGTGTQGTTGTQGAQGTTGTGTQGAQGISGAAGGLTATDDTTTNSTHYPVFVSALGSSQTPKGSSSKLTFNPSSGTISATVFNSLSDINKKYNIVKVKNSIDILNSINGVSFRWKDNHLPSLGVIAQDIEKVLPELVDQNKSVNYNGIMAILIEAIKELKAEVDELKKKS